MKKQVTFEIKLQYTVTLETNEDSPTIEDAIVYKEDCLKIYREDLNEALIDSKLISIKQNND